MTDSEIRKPQFIDAALIEDKGDPSVGIPARSTVISDIFFDLSTLDAEDKADAVEVFRKKLADAFEVAWGDRPKVFFDTEIPFD